MSFRNHETQLNIWLFAVSVFYFSLGFCFLKSQSQLPENFLMGYVPAAVGAIALSLYAVRIDSDSSRMRSYAGLMQYRFRLMTFLIDLFLILICCATEELLQFGGAMAGFFTFLLVREIQLAITNKIIKIFPADYPESEK